MRGDTGYTAWGNKMPCDGRGGALWGRYAGGAVIRMAGGGAAGHIRLAGWWTVGVGGEGGAPTINAGLLGKMGVAAIGRSRGRSGGPCLMIIGELWVVLDGPRSLMNLDERNAHVTHACDNLDCWERRNRAARSTLLKETKQERAAPS